jgi:hypothetical protein
MSINNLSFGDQGHRSISQLQGFTRGETGQRIKQALYDYRQKAALEETPQTPAAPGTQALRGQTNGVDYDSIARALMARLDALWGARKLEWGDAATSHACCCHHHEPSGVAASSPETPVTSSRSGTNAPAATPTGSTGGPSTPTSEADLPFDEVRGLVLNEDNNLNIVGVHINGTENGVLVDNGQLSENVTIDGLVAENTTRYGMYLGAVRNWTITNTSLQQAAGASEHGLRIADGEHITINNTTIDTTRAGKSALWLINVDDAVVENSTISGGAIRIGARPNDNQGSPDVTNIVIRDSVINKVSGGDGNAFEVWPGSNHIHLENLDITCTTASTWLSIDSRNTANITWENVRVNGELVTGFEGVRLGGMTEEEALARGIGPAGAVA